MAARSERLKKLELDLQDLEHWLKLGLVPKRDLTKHKGEIEGLKLKIEEEKRRLQFLKETGEIEEYVTPRKQPARPAYSESPTLPELDIAEEPTTITEMSSESESESFIEQSEEERGEEEEEEESEEIVEEEEEEDADPFSDRNRWKRGMLHGNDEDEW
jgi:hypothetical protein